MITQLILDVDGVLTDGKLLYSNQGKIYKVFGPHDRDGLKRISKYISDIQFITADKTGFSITEARIIKDWGYSKEQLHIVPEESRMEWFTTNCDLDKTAFIGDGINDAPILEIVKAGIAPANARIEARTAAKYVTPSKSGEGAVLDACLWLERIINGLEQV